MESAKRWGTVVDQEFQDGGELGVWSPRRGGGNQGWVRAVHLENWSERLDARAMLPTLIRRLVYATAKGLSRLEFPSGEQTQRPGWDGIVEAGEGCARVPAGTSVWEMGVDGTPKTKAEQDFSKRSKDPLGLDPTRTTFVFVTPRKWQDKEKWRQSKTGLDIWKDVRVYDSATLEEWLESALAVDAWLAKMLGKRPAGLITLDEHWDNLRRATEPAFSADVFLASRKQQVDDLDAWFTGTRPGAEEQAQCSGSWPAPPPGALAIEARSSAEAIDFVAAFAQDPSRAELFHARTLIVESREAWRGMAASDEGLLLIAGPSLSIEPEMVAEAVRGGHRVLIPTTLPQREQGRSLKLSVIQRYDLETALKSSGLGEEEARRLARDSGGSSVVLKRLRAKLPGNVQPDWSRPPEATSLVPLLLAGAWDESSGADRAAIELLSESPYDFVAVTVGRWLRASDPPLTRTGDGWRLTSLGDCWHLLGIYVTADDLKRFHAVVCEVFAEDDPALELPPRERWSAAIPNGRSRCSSMLRHGLAETLAILGAMPEGVTEAARAPWLLDQTVHELLDGKGWLRWASLSRELPLLAEASPRSFLDAIEVDLNRSRPSLLDLFQREHDSTFASSPYTGLLWALETLAWDRTHLPRVSAILASLDEAVPTRKTGNSPSRSLAGILMPWSPRTMAPARERIRVLQKLAKSHPDATMRILMDHLPNRHAAPSPTARPSWRDWAITWSPNVSTADYWDQADASARLLAGLIGADVSRWEEVIKQFEHIPPPARSTFFERLDVLVNNDLDGTAGRALSEVLRVTIARHRRYADADWALRGEVVDELERVLERLVPDDPVLRNAWLFGARWELIAILGDRAGQREESRRVALNEVIEERGWRGVLELATMVESPDELGAALADTERYERDVVPALLASTDEKLVRFASGYASRVFARLGWDWIDRLAMEGWTIEQMGRLLVLLPCDVRVWDLAAAQGDDVIAWYWRHVPPYHTWDSQEGATHAIRMLLGHGRPAAAVRVITMASHDKVAISPGVLMDVLQNWLECRVAAGEWTDSFLVKYEIPQVFCALQGAVSDEESAVDVQRLARLEWGFLGLLDGQQCSPTTLHDLLQTDPDFFVQVLSLVFRSKHVSAEEPPELSEEERLRGANAYQLLETWRVVPGLLDDGTVDGERLSQWLRKARHRAEEGGRLGICDLRIGVVFAHAPEEADGSWPCISVRDALEEIGTADVFRGFGVGIYNKRGVYSKSTMAGGDQERTLAEKYRAYAEACHIDWPMTSDRLRRVADAYGR